MKHKQQETLHSPCGDNVKDKINALKETYLTHRQVGASEAVYKTIPSLRLKDSNLSCIFVMTGFPQNRSTFFNRVREDPEEFQDIYGERQEDNECDDNENDGFEESVPVKSNTFTIEGRQGMYQESITLIERYIARPECLEMMCLAQFATSYVFASKVPKRIAFDGKGKSNKISNQTIFGSSKCLPRYISLKSSGYGMMRLRKFPAVMRIHASKKKEGHEQFNAELQLYTHWRDEKTFHADDAKKCNTKYERKLEEIQRNKEIIYPGEGTLDLLENLDLEKTKPTHMFDLLDSQREQEKDDDMDLGSEDDPAFESFAYTGNLVEEKDTNYESSRYRKINLPEEDERNFLTRRLVPEQLDVLRDVTEYCKDVLKSKKKLDHQVEPLRIVVHGGAGVGKSALIRVSAMHAEKILRKRGDKPNHPRVLLTAHTGKAASLIEGQTICGAFGFRFGDDSQGAYSDSTLAKLRTDLSELALIIIDEMSLVSSDLLYKLNAKLKEIFSERKNTPFGGIGIMLVGDLLQIPPVTGSYIFSRPYNTNHRVAYDIHNLWQLFKPWILKHNHRQGESSDWASILNEFREGIVSQENLALLQSRETMDDHHDFDALHLCFTNEESQDHNNKMLSKLNTTLFETEAIKRYPKGRKPIIKSGGRIEDLNVLDVLSVKVGARVVLVYNVNTIDDLVNGSTGTIVAIESDENGGVKCIIVKFDKDSMGQEQRMKYTNYADKYKENNGTPIFREEMETLGRRRTGQKLGLGSMAKIRQYPLVLFYASTNHKIQGSTVPSNSKVVIHWSEAFKSSQYPGMAYVALGRTEKLKDIYIKGKVDPEDIHASTEALEETKRLQTIFDQRKANLSKKYENHLKISYLNVRSLRAHKEDVAIDSVLMGSDIFALGETHLEQEETVTLPGLKGYFASHGKGKGVSVFSKMEYVNRPVVNQVSSQFFLLFTIGP